MTAGQTAVTVAIMAGATMLTRFLPFILFPEGKKAPWFVSYLGRSLPYAAIGMLVVYCLKDVSFTEYPYGIPEAASILVIAALNRWKGNVLLSIGGGTAAYMLLVNLAFR